MSAALQKQYGVSYAGAYARCIDAGLSKNEAEASLARTVQRLTLGLDPSDHAVSARAHAVLVKEETNV